jgi:hypothetical protein
LPLRINDGLFVFARDDRPVKHCRIRFYDGRWSAEHGKRLRFAVNKLRGHN